MNFLIEQYSGFLGGCYVFIKDKITQMFIFLRQPSREL